MPGKQDFAISDLFRKNMVALDMSKTPYSDMDSLFTAERKDFYNYGRDYCESLTPDRRAIAGAHDPYLFIWDYLTEPHPEWMSYVWVHEELRMLLCDLKNPTKALFTNPVGGQFLMTLSEDRSKEVFFINNLEYNVLERFVKQSPEWASKDPNWKVMDQQDLLAGEEAGTFDFVETHAEYCFGCDEEMADAYMDLLNPGGMLVILNSAYAKGMYKIRNSLHHENYEPNKRLLERDGFTVLHFPIDVGFTIIQREAS